MNRIALPLLGVTLLVTPLPLLSTSALAQDAEEAVDKQQTVSTVNTMRKALVISLNRELSAHYAPDDDESGDGGDTESSAAPVVQYSFATGGGPFFMNANGGASNSRGHYIPGHGAIFSLQLTVPRVAVEVEEIEVEPADEEDEIWAEAEGRKTSTISGIGPQTLIYRMAGTTDDAAKVTWILDEEGVDVAVKSVIRAIGNYGLRVSGVGSDESIIVALDVEGGKAIHSGTSTTSSGTRQFFNVISGSSTVDGRKIVIEVSRRDIDRYADDDSDLPALISRAKVTTYVTPSRSGSSYVPIASPAPAPTRPRVDRTPGSSSR